MCRYGTDFFGDGLAIVTFLPRLLVYYHFFCGYAIVLVMNAVQTEIVIIPHPNEQKRLADAQKAMLSAAQARTGDVWVPWFPLYVRGFGESTLATAKNDFLGCAIAGARVTEDSVVFDAEVVTKGGMCAGIVTVAKRLRGGGDAEADDLQRAVSAACGDAFPMRLPVFRVARVEFRQSDERVEWTVQESAWVKGR